jgi:hypothetical protein
MAALGLSPDDASPPINEEELDAPLLVVLARAARDAIRAALTGRPPPIPFNQDLDARLEDGKRWWDVSAVLCCAVLWVCGIVAPVSTLSSRVD